MAVSTYKDASSRQSARNGEGDGDGPGHEGPVEEEKQAVGEESINQVPE